MCFGIHRALFLPVCPTIRDEMHTWEPMSQCWCIANQVCSICLSASHLPLGSTAPCLILCHSNTMAHIHALEDTLYSIQSTSSCHIKSISVIIYNSGSQLVSCEPKMGHRSVLIWWQTAGKKALLCSNTKMDMLCDMPLTSMIMNKTMQCKRGNNLNTLTLGSLETRVNEVCGMSDYFKAFSCVVYEAWNLTYTKEVSSHFTFNNGRIYPPEIWPQHWYSKGITAEN